MKEIKKLKKILKDQDITFENAAHEIGVTFQTVWKWMNGVHKPSKLALAQLRKLIKKYERYVPFDKR